MNKYKDKARQIRLAKKKQRMCEGKVAYQTAEAAHVKGQRFYRCPFCGLYHRSGSFAKFAAYVRGRK